MMCLQETKVTSMSVSMTNELTRPDFDYLCVPSDGASGGICVAWHRDHWVAGAPTVPVLYDYIQLWEILENIELNPIESDRFIWHWSGDGRYSASSAYHSFIGRTPLRGAKQVWRAVMPPKVTFFFWLALHMAGSGRQNDDGATAFRATPPTSSVTRWMKLVITCSPVASSAATSGTACCVWPAFNS